MTSLFPAYTPAQPLYTNRLEKAVYRISVYFAKTKEDAVSIYRYAITTTKANTHSGNRETLILIYRVIKTKAEDQIKKERTDFEKEIIKYKPAMLRRAMMKVHNAEEARELVQIAIFKAIKHNRKHGVNTNNIPAFLCRIVDNTFLDDCRKKKVRQDAVIDAEEAVYNYGEGSFLQSNVTACIQTLPKIQRRIVRMFMEGYKPKDMAKATGLKEIYVEEVKAQAFETLKALLKQDIEFSK